MDKLAYVKMKNFCSQGHTWGKAGILLSMQIPFWSLFFQLDCLLSRVCSCTHRLNKVPSHPFFFSFTFLLLSWWPYSTMRQAFFSLSCDLYHWFLRFYYNRAFHGSLLQRILWTKRPHDGRRRSHNCRFVGGSECHWC